VGNGLLGVVLVHGFNSGPTTWGPLQERIEQDESLGFVRVLPFSYATGVRRWHPLRVFPGINTVADSLKEFVRTEAGAFGDLVVVTHSMGGLVVQRYLARMLADGHGRELARIRRVVMLACPNDGSELLLSLRRGVFGGGHPQEKELRPLNEQVTETRRTLVHDVLHAREVTDRTCPIPFSVYAGDSDRVVSVSSARSVFSDAAALPGDHFSILKVTTPDHRTFTTLRRILHETKASTDRPSDTRSSSSGPAVGPARPGGLPPAAWPLQVGVIPPRAGAFQDRAERARLRQTVAGGGTAVLGQAQPAKTAGELGAGQVLSGMGGVGKTQLAADHARTAWTEEELDLLVWVTAVDREGIVGGLGRAGVEVAGADPSDPGTAAAAFVAWLEPKAGQDRCRWLVVLDDVSDPADLEGLWPPASPWGRALITTRRRDAAFTHDGRHRIDVGLFTPAEAVAYLAAVLASHGRTEPTSELAALAEDLGRLPLALSQAAAFMADADMTCQDYQALLASRTVTLADASPQPLPPGHTRTMAVAWDLSVQRADAMRPAGLARPLLQLAAFLDPNGIPAAVLTAPAVLAFVGEQRVGTADPAPGGVSAADVTAGLRVLHRLSLIDHTPTDPHRTVGVHALIQRTTRDTLTTDQHTTYARAAADALVTAWPDFARDTELAQSLRANTTVLAAHAEHSGSLYRPGAHEVMFLSGYSLGESGQGAAAVAYFQNLADNTSRHLGPDHPDTFKARNNLANWRGDAGDAAGAAAAFADLLDDQLRVLGPDHHDILGTRHNLATWRGVAGDSLGAAAAFAELLDDRLRVLGPDHRDTFSTRHNLAVWRGDAGGAGDAAVTAAALAELLEDQLRMLGPDHHDTLTTRRVLAWWRGEAGDAAGAAAAFADLLDDIVRVLGPDHYDTLNTRHSLADWRGKSGDAAGAAAAFADLLDDRLRVLGPDHPHTLTARNSLARWRAGNGEGSETRD
jgi:hypothetical protein